MRGLVVDGEYSSIASMSVSSQEDIILGSCSLPALCNPSPCEHGGTCRQEYSHAYCACYNTGYTGAVCHTSLHYRSCMQALQGAGGGHKVDTVLDMDGSGPLPPITVQCEVSTTGEYVTSITHSHMEDTKVDGFQARGSFHQVIYYNAPEDVINYVVRISGKCWQSLWYDCKQSRLYNKTEQYGWWVSWQGEAMDYWPGGVAGKCGCGVQGECYDPGQVCHCDSGHDGWLQDGGDIHHKEQLPVRALHFGDTGTPLDNKEGRFRLGLLHCIGDKRFERETGAVKIKRVINNQGENQEHLAEVFFEFLTEEDTSVELFYEQVDRENYIKVVLGDKKIITYEWTNRGRRRNISVVSGRVLNDGHWHSVNIERNIMEVMVVVDRKEINNMRERNVKLSKLPSYIPTEMKVSTVHSSRNDILIVLQNNERASQVRIRGLEINGKSVTYIEGDIKYPQDLNINDNTDSPIIPLGAVHSSVDSPFSHFFLSTNHIVSISLLSLTFLMTIAVCGVLRYLRTHQPGQHFIQPGHHSEHHSDRPGQESQWVL